MQKLKFTIIFGLIFLTSTLQTLASETRLMVLQGGLTANTETTIWIHNALPVTARFKMRRDGSDNDFAKRKVRFILLSPNGSISVIIPSIGGKEETFDLKLDAAGGANNIRIWKVEMKNFEDAANTEVGQAVRGIVEFFTTDSQIATIPSPPKFGLVQAESATKTITMPFTGNLTIQANWDTDEFSLEAYQLKFQLYKGNALLASDTGYSRDSIVVGASDNQRMKITYRVKSSDFQISGDWKVKVFGSSKGKVKNVDFKMKISDGLYE
jgi:hypothetical protein